MPVELPRNLVAVTIPVCILGVPLRPDDKPVKLPRKPVEVTIPKFKLDVVVDNPVAFPTKSPTNVAVITPTVIFAPCAKLLAVPVTSPINLVAVIIPAVMLSVVEANPVALP